MTIGERIKKRRLELNMTQEQLAAKLGYKSKSSINKIELNDRNLTQPKIKLIADALLTTPEYIMGWNTVQKTGQDSGYYEPETLEMAQALYDNPDLRALMKAAMELNRDSIPNLTKLLYDLKGTNPDG